MAQAKALVRSLLAWFRRNARDLPWRKTTDPYAIWVSEIMLQQTQVKTVIPYWERWMRRFPTFQALATSHLDDVLKLWEGLGYYTRARHLHEAARIILAKYDGTFPRRFDDILALPGIGHYSAGAICSIAFNQPKPILDANVTRVLTRLLGIRQDPRKARVRHRLWTVAEELVHQARQMHPARGRSCASLNEALMELGATVCTPRQPRCSVCPLRSPCAARAANLSGKLPKRTPRPPSRAQRIVVFVISRRGRYLIRRRPAHGVNANLWEFPNQETALATPDIKRSAASCLGFCPQRLVPLCRIRHTITRSAIALDVFLGTATQASASRLPSSQWRAFEELDDLAFPSAHRKIVNALQAKLTQTASK